MDEIDWNGIIWKRVPGYDSYFASKDGRIISTTRGVDKAIIMKPMSACRGHLYVFMYKNRKELCKNNLTSLSLQQTISDGF